VQLDETPRQKEDTTWISTNETLTLDFDERAAWAFHLLIPCGSSSILHISSPLYHFTLFLFLPFSYSPPAPLPIHSQDGPF
jgi:hypothetical protein